MLKWRHGFGHGTQLECETKTDEMPKCRGQNPSENLPCSGPKPRIMKLTALEDESLSSGSSELEALFEDKNLKKQKKCKPKENGKSKRIIPTGSPLVIWLSDSLDDEPDQGHAKDFLSQTPKKRKRQQKKLNRGKGKSVLSSNVFLTNSSSDESSNLEKNNNDETKDKSGNSLWSQNQQIHKPRKKLILRKTLSVKKKTVQSLSDQIEEFTSDEGPITTYKTMPVAHLIESNQGKGTSANMGGNFRKAPVTGEQMLSLCDSLKEWDLKNLCMSNCDSSSSKQSNLGRCKPFGSRKQLQLSGCESSGSSKQSWSGPSCSEHSKLNISGFTISSNQSKSRSSEFSTSSKQSKSVSSGFTITSKQSNSISSGFATSIKQSNSISSKSSGSEHLVVPPIVYLPEGKWGKHKKQHSTENELKVFKKKSETLGSGRFDSVKSSYMEDHFSSESSSDVSNGAVFRNNELDMSDYDVAKDALSPVFYRKEKKLNVPVTKPFMSKVECISESDSDPVRHKVIVKKTNVIRSDCESDAKQTNGTKTARVGEKCLKMEQANEDSNRNRTVHAGKSQAESSSDNDDLVPLAQIDPEKLKSKITEYCRTSRKQNVESVTCLANQTSSVSPQTGPSRLEKPGQPGQHRANQISPVINKDKDKHHDSEDYYEDDDYYEDSDMSDNIIPSSQPFRRSTGAKSSLVDVIMQLPETIKKGGKFVYKPSKQRDHQNGSPNHKQCNDPKSPTCPHQTCQKSTSKSSQISLKHDMSTSNVRPHHKLNSNWVSPTSPTRKRSVSPESLSSDIEQNQCEGNSVTKKGIKNTNVKVIECEVSSHCADSQNGSGRLVADTLKVTPKMPVVLPCDVCSSAIVRESFQKCVNIIKDSVVMKNVEREVNSVVSMNDQVRIPDKAPLEAKSEWEVIAVSDSDDSVLLFPYDNMLPDLQESQDQKDDAPSVVEEVLNNLDNKGETLRFEGHVNEEDLYSNQNVIEEETLLLPKESVSAGEHVPYTAACTSSGSSNSTSINSTNSSRSHLSAVTDRSEQCQPNGSSSKCNSNIKKLPLSKSKSTSVGYDESSVQSPVGKVLSGKSTDNVMMYYSFHDDDPIVIDDDEDDFFANLTQPTIKVEPQEVSDNGEREDNMDEVIQSVDEFTSHPEMLESWMDNDTFSQSEGSEKVEVPPDDEFELPEIHSRKIKMSELKSDEALVRACDGVKVQEKKYANESEMVISMEIELDKLKEQANNEQSEDCLVQKLDRAKPAGMYIHDEITVECVQSIAPVNNELEGKNLESGGGKSGSAIEELLAMKQRAQMLEKILAKSQLSNLSTCNVSCMVLDSDSDLEIIEDNTESSSKDAGPVTRDVQDSDTTNQPQLHNKVDKYANQNGGDFDAGDQPKLPDKDGRHSGQGRGKCDSNHKLEWHKKDITETTVAEPSKHVKKASEITSDDNEDDVVTFLEDQPALQNNLVQEMSDTELDECVKKSKHANPENETEQLQKQDSDDQWKSLKRWKTDEKRVTKLKRKRLGTEMTLYALSDQGRLTTDPSEPYLKKMKKVSQDRPKQRELVAAGPSEVKSQPQFQKRKTDEQDKIEKITSPKVIVKKQTPTFKKDKVLKAMRPQYYKVKNSFYRDKSSKGSSTLTLAETGIMKWKGGAKVKKKDKGKRKSEPRFFLTPNINKAKKVMQERKKQSKTTNMSKGKEKIIKNMQHGDDVTSVINKLLDPEVGTCERSRDSLPTVTNRLLPVESSSSSAKDALKSQVETSVTKCGYHVPDQPPKHPYPEVHILPRYRVPSVPRIPTPAAIPPTSVPIGQKAQPPDLSGLDLLLDDYIATITRWNPVWLREKEKVGEPPPVVQFMTNHKEIYPGIPDGQSPPLLPLLVQGYDSYRDYVRITYPLFLHETWEHLFCKWKARQDLRKPILTSVAINHLQDKKPKHLDFLVQGVLSQEQSEQSLYPMDGTVVNFIPKVREKSSGRIAKKAVIGYVSSFWKTSVSHTKDEVHKLHLSNPLLKEKGAMLFNAVIRIFHRKIPIDPEFLVTVEVLDSIIPLIRQFHAFRSLWKCQLAREILRPTNVKATFFHKPQKSVQNLKKYYNESQVDAIGSVGDAILQPYALCKICLIQGPPGTGKSHTIVGIIKRVLTQKFIDRDTLPKILLMAPSNAAVDELMKKLIKDKDDPHHWSVPINFVRVGFAGSINGMVKEYSIDHLVKQESIRQIKNRSMPPSIKAELANIATSLKDLQSQKEVMARNRDKLKFHQVDMEIRKLEKKKSQLEASDKEQVFMKLSRKEEYKIKESILRAADVVCCTLNGSGSISLQNLLRRNPQNRPHFTAIIVDEASQATELECLIPLQYGCTKLVLVGDPEQLPATVLSQKSEDYSFGLSLFERLQKFFKDKEDPVKLLRTQYRMHPDICRFPSQHIYGGKVITHSETAKLREQFPYQNYHMFDLNYGQEKQVGTGFVNMEEVTFTVALCEYLTSHHSIKSRAIGIITPYQQQKNKLLEALAKSNLHIEAGTVDGFQGREKDIIIFTCVRGGQGARGSIGFLKDRRRLNVSLTRARYALYLVGSLKLLRANIDWQHLVDDAVNRKKITTVATSGEILAQLKSGLKKENKHSIPAVPAVSALPSRHETSSGQTNIPPVPKALLSAPPAVTGRSASEVKPVLAHKGNETTSSEPMHLPLCDKKGTHVNLPKDSSHNDNWHNISSGLPFQKSHPCRQRYPQNILNNGDLYQIQHKNPLEKKDSNRSKARGTSLDCNKSDLHKSTSMLTNPRNRISSRSDSGSKSSENSNSSRNADNRSAKARHSSRSVDGSRSSRDRESVRSGECSRSSRDRDSSRSVGSTRISRARDINSSRSNITDQSSKDRDRNVSKSNSAGHSSRTRNRNVSRSNSVGQSAK